MTGEPGADPPALHSGSGPATPDLMGPGLIRLRLRIADADVVFLRSILEAYDGLGTLHGDGSGIVAITAPRALREQLEGLISDLSREGLSVTVLS